MMQRIFFFDFDDTLFSHATKRVPESAHEALIALQDAGYPVVIATGRGPESVEFVRAALDIPVEWMIVLNGQIIFQNGEKVYERFITLPSIQEVCSIAEAHGVPYGGYYSGGELVNKIDNRVQRVWEDFHCPLPDEIPDFMARYPLYQGHLYVTQEEADQYFKPFLPDYLINWSHPTLLNLISRETGKSQGIDWMLKTTGIPRENAYAFGDGFNDKDMLLAVGHGVAMRNGSDDLKSVAEYVAPSPDEDGIYKTLQHYRLMQ